MCLQTMLLQRLKSQAAAVGELIEPELTLGDVPALPEGASEVRGWRCLASCAPRRGLGSA
jgi:hypothetical protein